MYKKSYKYLGILALLWTYSSCTIHAVGLRDEHKAPETHKIQHSQCYTALIDAHNKFTKGYKAPNNVNQHNIKLKKRKAVMVIGTLPRDHLKNMGCNGALASYELSSMEEISKIYNKYLGDMNLKDDAKRSRNKPYEDWIKMEATFMGKTYCDHSYIQYVTRPYHLPNLYVSQEDSEKPIYIVVPFVTKLVDNIFFYFSAGSFGVSDLEKKGIAGYRERLDESIALLNAYMEQVVYPLVDIKTLVINYDGTEVMNVTDIISAYEILKLDHIDLMIRSFGTLLYSGKKINPQVFWVNWYKGDKDQENSYQNKQEKFYAKLLLSWFQLYCEYKLWDYRRTSLLYPFVKAHAPEMADYYREKAAYSTREEDITLYNYDLRGYKEVYRYMPETPLKDKHRPQMALLSIDDILLSEKKQEKAKVFTHIVERVKNATTSIASDRFRFWFAIRCHLLQLLTKNDASFFTIDNGPQLRHAMNGFLCQQKDIPEQTLAMIGLKGTIAMLRSSYNNQFVHRLQLVFKRYKRYASKYNKEKEIKAKDKKSKKKATHEYDNIEHASLVHWDKKYTKDERKYNAGNGFGGMYIFSGKNHQKTEQINNKSPKDKNNVPPHSALQSIAFAGLKLHDVVGPTSICILLSLFSYVYKSLNTKSQTNKVSPEGDGPILASPPPSPEKPEVPDHPSGVKVFLNNFLHHFFFYAALLLLLVSIGIGCYFRRRRKKKPAAPPHTQEAHNTAVIPETQEDNNPPQPPDVKKE